MLFEFFRKLNSFIIKSSCIKMKLNGWNPILSVAWPISSNLSSIIFFVVKSLISDVSGTLLGQPLLG